MTFLDITISGSTAYIYTQSTDCTIGITGSVAHIVTGGYNYDVTGTVTGVGNIQYLPLTLRSVFYDDNVMESVPYPHEPGSTMKGATQLIPTIVKSYAGLTPYDYNFTFNHMFDIHQVNGDPVATRNLATRMNIPRTVDGGGLTSEESVILTNLRPVKFAVYDDSTIHVCSYTTAGDSENRLSEVEYCSGTITTLYNWNNTGVTFGLAQYDYINTIFINYCKTDDFEKLVIVERWADDGMILSDSNDILKVIVYNITTGAVDHEAFYNLTSEGYNVTAFFEYFTAPVIYDTKLIFSVTIDGWPNPLPGNFCTFPAFIVDFDANTVTRADNLKVNPDTLQPFVFSSGLDRTTGIYYYMLEDYLVVDQTALGKMDLSGSTLAIETSGLEYYFWLNSGDNYCYAVEYITATQEAQLRAVPALTTIGAIVDTYRFYPWMADEKKDTFWFITESELTGRNLTDGSSSTIPIDWAGGSIPFDYPASRRVSLVVLAGTAFIRVQSTTIGNSQTEWYVLKPEFDCGV